MASSRMLQRGTKINKYEGNKTRQRASERARRSTGRSAQVPAVPSTFWPPHSAGTATALADAARRRTKLSHSHKALKATRHSGFCSSVFYMKLRRREIPSFVQTSASERRRRVVRSPDGDGDAGVRGPAQFLSRLVSTQQCGTVFPSPVLKQKENSMTCV